MSSLPDIETPDLDVIATQLAKVKRSAQLSDVLTGISAQDTMQGSSTLTLHLEDQDFELLDTGFFDADENGRLDAVDINYPDNTKYWWRLTQVTPNASGNLDLTFMERPACLMLDLFGPLKVSRAKMTRAEFIDFLARHVKQYGGIQFHSTELHQKQKLAKVKKGDRRKNKAHGAHKKDDITIKGVGPTQEQIDNVNTSLDVADQQKAPKLACIAMLCAGIGESSFVAQPNAGGSNYWGVFQGSKDVWKMDDTAGMAKSFLMGGKGFQGGGAISLAKKHPEMDPGGIATLVEASGQPGHFYGTYKAEAEKLFRAYGGMSGSGGTRNKQYNFEVGSQDNPHETYWDAANRLAQEVNWALFLDGNDLFYDSELELVKQQPVAVIHRDDPEVIDWDYTWDVRHVATEMSLTLICEPFEFRAGEVFLLKGFGAASVGSTAMLPGRWLISESDRDRTSFSTVFTLKQPTKPNPEPRAGTVSRTPAAKGGKVSASDLRDATPKSIIDDLVLPVAAKNGLKTPMGLPLTPSNVTAANATHGATTSGGRSDHQGPPSFAWAADMSNGWMTAAERKTAHELASTFGIPWSGTGIASHTRDGFRFQLIWGINLGQAGGGEHRNHVHFGVKRA